MIAYAKLSSPAWHDKEPLLQGQALQKRSLRLSGEYTRHSLFSHRRHSLLQLGIITYTNLIALFANDMIPGGQNTQGMIRSYHLMETAATDAVILSQ